MATAQDTTPRFPDATRHFYSTLDQSYLLSLFADCLDAVQGDMALSEDAVLGLHRLLAKSAEVLQEAAPYIDVAATEQAWQNKVVNQPAVAVPPTSHEDYRKQAVDLIKGIFDEAAATAPTPSLTEPLPTARSDYSNEAYRRGYRHGYVDAVKEEGHPAEPDMPHAPDEAPTPVLTETVPPQEREQASTDEPRQRA